MRSALVSVWKGAADLKQISHRHRWQQHGSQICICVSRSKQTCRHTWIDAEPSSTLTRAAPTDALPTTTLLSHGGKLSQ